MSVATLVLLGHTAVLVVASLLLIYPVVAYAWNVAYTREIQLLAVAFVLLAGGYVSGIAIEADVASSLFDLGSSLCAFWAMWRLANRVGDPETTDISVEPTGPDVEGGFRGGD